MVASLWTIRQAARHLGVPVSALERAAQQYGYIIQVGSAKRLRPDELQELVEQCRVRPKVPVSISSPGPAVPRSG
jgi:hypothetical protein